MDLLQIHPSDNVAVALTDLPDGAFLTLENGLSLTASEAIPRGHKIALQAIFSGSPVIKYGCPIGSASCDITPGQWVHTHNMHTGLSEDTRYRYDHKVYPLPEVSPRTFSGFRRDDGRAAVRNEA